jgi:hypothetical protein
LDTGPNSGAGCYRGSIQNRLELVRRMRTNRGSSLRLPRTFRNLRWSGQFPIELKDASGSPVGSGLLVLVSLCRSAASPCVRSE